MVTSDLTAEVEICGFMHALCIRP